MTKRVMYQLTSEEKDKLLEDQSALIEQQAELIASQRQRIADLEAGQGKPRKTSKNSHNPPSKDMKGSSKTGSSSSKKGKKKPRPARAGISRSLSASPNERVQVQAQNCQHCDHDVSQQSQHVRHRYDWIDLPVVSPHITRIELLGGRCACCKRRFKAQAPQDKPVGTPFGPQIHSCLLYLHNTHHISFERLSEVMKEMFGLSISEGAIHNAFVRLHAPLEQERGRILAVLRQAKLIPSDETTSRINGNSHWHWTFVSDDAIYHEIVPSRGKKVAEDVLGTHRPEVWISDRYAGQQDLGKSHQVCLAHVLRDVQYAIDCGDSIFAPKLRKLLV